MSVGTAYGAFAMLLVPYFFKLISFQGPCFKSFMSGSHQACWSVNDCGSPLDTVGNAPLTLH